MLQLLYSISKEVYGKNLTIGTVYDGIQMTNYVTLFDGQGIKAGSISQALEKIHKNYCF
jgi:hypothetical protein